MARVRSPAGVRAAGLLATPADPTAHPVPAHLLELARLLEAAAAPATPAELASEPAARKAFRATRSASVSSALATLSTHATPAGVPPKAAVAGGPGRSVRWALKVAVGALAILLGGTAVAAEAGALPDPMQRRAHDLLAGLGVPPPTTSRRPPAPSRGPSPIERGTSSAPSTLSGSPTPADLCRAWREAQDDPKGKALAAEQLRALAKAAGGNASVPRYCAGILASAGPTVTPTASRSNPATATATPSVSATGSDDGNGNKTKTKTNGNGNGNGNGGNDNGNGNNGNGNNKGHGAHTAVRSPHG